MEAPKSLAAITATITLAAGLVGWGGWKFGELVAHDADARYAVAQKCVPNPDQPARIVAESEIPDACLPLKEAFRPEQEAGKLTGQVIIPPGEELLSRTRGEAAVQHYAKYILGPGGFLLTAIVGGGIGGAWYRDKYPPTDEAFMRKYKIKVVKLPVRKEEILWDMVGES